MCIGCNPGMILASRETAPLSFPPIAVTDDRPRLPSGSRRRRRRQARSADHIFSGGPILTMSAPHERVEAVAVRDGRIVAAGSATEVDRLDGPDTSRIDLDGRCLLPGFVEPHMHFVFVQFDDWVDLSPMTTPTFDDVVTALRSAASTGEGWVRAKLFDPSITLNARPPTLADLDAIAPDRPLFVLEGNGHVAYVNSAALTLAGVTRETADPPTARFGRDAVGELTGRLEEAHAYLPFLAKMGRVSPDELTGRVRRMMRHAASMGCTTLHDCGIGLLSGADDIMLLRAVQDDDPVVRYGGMLVSTHMERWKEMGLQPGFGDDRFRVYGIKAWSDGSNQAGTGFQRQPYVAGDSRGALNYTADQLAAVVADAHAAGWQVGVHANGDAAIDVTIDAYEQALSAHPRDDHRHRIEHCSVLHDDQIERMAALGLSPSFLIGHVRWWGRAFRDRLLGPERARRYDPCASALAAGLRISLHSDWNVTPIEPLRYVEDATARIMAEGGEVLAPDERVSVDAALRAVTIDAAWQCRVDDMTGSITPGKSADFAVLESDPTATDPARIARIAVSETWLGGARTHTAG